MELLAESDEKALHSSWKIHQEGLSLRDKKRVYKSDLQATTKEKKRRQAEDQRKTRREAALRDIDGNSYEAGAF